VPYPKKLLKADEHVALDLRPHWWYFWKHIVTGIVLFGLLLLLAAKVHGDVFHWSFLFWAVVALVWAGWLTLKYFDWTFTHFVVTDDRVIFRTGVLAKRGIEIPMERISNINFHQGIWERLIGAGDLEIESAGKDGQSHFNDIWHPDAVQQELYVQMEANARKRASWSHPGAAPSPPPAPAPAPAPSRPDVNVPDQLRELAELRDRGIITPAEFETKKAQLLERM
jgi:membrane protein YdbS with pleckstrin-like domain